jgi:hypothetical protein
MQATLVVQGSGHGGPTRGGARSCVGALPGTARVDNEAATVGSLPSQLYSTATSPDGQTHDQSTFTPERSPESSVPSHVPGSSCDVPYQLGSMCGFVK